MEYTLEGFIQEILISLYFDIKNRAKRLKAIGKGHVPLGTAITFLVLSDEIIKENSNG